MKQIRDLQGCNNVLQSLGQYTLVLFLQHSQQTDEMLWWVDDEVDRGAFK